MVTAYGVNDRRSIPGTGKIFLFSIAARPALRPTQPHILWVVGTVSPGVKRQELEAEHSPPSRAQVETGGAR
jgi:hypothetical protein